MIGEIADKLLKTWDLVEIHHEYQECMRLHSFFGVRRCYAHGDHAKIITMSDQQIAAEGSSLLQVVCSEFDLRIHRTCQRMTREGQQDISQGNHD